MVSRHFGWTLINLCYAGLLSDIVLPQIAIKKMEEESATIRTATKEPAYNMLEIT